VNVHQPSKGEARTGGSNRRDDDDEERKEGDTEAEMMFPEILVIFPNIMGTSSRRTVVWGGQVPR
jgi:hypothetical protein